MTASLLLCRGRRARVLAHRGCGSAGGGGEWDECADASHVNYQSDKEVGGTGVKESSPYTIYDRA